VTFSTVDSTAGTDTFGTPEEAISCEDADNTTYGCAVAVDSNDIPHAVVIGSDAYMGSDYNMLYYDNKIGGSWADRREIEGATGSKNLDYPDIAINSDNYPVIVYVNTTDSTLDAVEGNANDPTTFATREVDASVTTGVTNKPTICVDSNGDAWVAYVDSDGTIDIAEQSANWTDAWTIVSNGNSGTEPSIVADGTDIYVFYEEDGSDDIVYDKYDGSWLGETQLQTSVAYNSVKARWSYFHNPPGVASVTNSGNIWLYGGSGTYEELAQSFTTGSYQDVRITRLSLLMRKTGSPSDNVYAEIRTGSETGTLIATSNDVAGSGIPTVLTWTEFTFSSPVTLTSSSVYYLVLKRDGSRDTTNHCYWGNDSSNPYAGGTRSQKDSGSWSNQVGDFAFIIPNEAQSQAVIDYVFDDGTNILWDNLSIAAPANRVGPQIMMLI
jgi:hypothetical protein